MVTGSDGFVYQTEQFSDLRILRYQVPGFKELPVKQKELLYYLYEAALCGRDIMWDQNYKYNLIIRKTIENICNSYTGDKNSDDYKNFLVYAKRVWFSNGIHHHYSSDKITPECTKEFLDLIKNSDQKVFLQLTFLLLTCLKLQPLYLIPPLLLKEFLLMQKQTCLKHLQ